MPTLIQESAVMHLRKGHDKLFLRYLDSVDVNITDIHGNTLLHYVVQYARNALIKALAEKAILINTTNEAGDTALHYAARFDNADAALQLLDLGAKIDLVNEHGNTPLHYACFYRFMDICGLLVTKGAAVRRLNKAGATPISRLADDQAASLLELATCNGYGVEELSYRNTGTYGAPFAMLISPTHIFTDVDEILHENQIGCTVKIDADPVVLGQGAFGISRLCSWNKHRVVCKELFGSAVSRDVREGLFNEIKHMSRMKKYHPSVIPLLGVLEIAEEDEDTFEMHTLKCFIISQYVPTGSLSRLLHERREIPIPFAKQLSLAYGVVRGLQFIVSELGLKFYDLKSTSIMVDERMNALLNLGDTGFAFNSPNRVIYKSAEYLAPEVLSDPKNASEHSYAYSFGVVFNEILSRTRPFSPRSSVQAAYAVLCYNARPDLDDGMKEPIVTIIRACWDAVPAYRPSVGDLHTFLHELASV